MNKIIIFSFSALILLFANFAVAQDDWRGAYPPPQANPNNYNRQEPYRAPQGYNRNVERPAPYGPPPGYNRNAERAAPPGYNRNAGPAPYGPPPRYYGDNRNYRGGPPRGYRYSRRNNNFFGFPGGGRGGDSFWPGGWRDDDGRGPWDVRTFTDPERFWDDMLGTPDYLPTMPGGWNVPSVSMPNPVEVGREIGEQSPEMLDAVRTY